MFQRLVAYIFSVVLLCFSVFTQAITNQPLGSEIKNQRQLQIKYPYNENLEHYRDWDKYFVDLLHLALSKTTHSYTATPHPISENEIQQSRSISLIQNSYFDIHWLTTNSKRERELLPIRIPLYKGLIGWRIMLIHSDNQQVFSNIDDIEQLKRLIGGQGRDWPDTEILTSNGFRLNNAVHTDSLIQMVGKKRIDYFPRSILEIWPEISANTNPNIVIENSLLVQYPLAVYFFLSNERKGAHKVIEQGLELAIADGSFDKLFYQYYSELIDRSKLKQRKRFSINNPQLTPETPLHKQEYWFQP